MQREAIEEWGLEPIEEEDLDAIEEDDPCAGGAGDTLAVLFDAVASAVLLGSLVLGLVFLVALLQAGS